MKTRCINTPGLIIPNPASDTKEVRIPAMVVCIAKASSLSRFGPRLDSPVAAAVGVVAEPVGVVVVVALAGSSIA